MNRLDAGLQVQQLARQMRAAAVARRGEIEFARMGPGVADQLLQRAGLDGRIHHQHVWRRREHGHRHEVARLIAEFREQDGIHGQVAGWGQPQRVAVRRGAGHGLHADIAGSAGLVVHHDGFAPLLAQLLADEARQRVRHAAGGEWHDDPHRLGGIGRMGVWLCAGGRGP
ncbi:hypothetical protein D3C81_1449080 [compost metagenome]